MATQRNAKQEKKSAADIVAEQLDADVILYNGFLHRPQDELLIGECTKRCRRENVLLVLVTPGGDADPAYRIAKCLQTKYKRFFLYVSGYCKSAGTLVAIGAHELIISDHGELGPLDVQLSKEDELGERRSGLAISNTLEQLQNDAFDAFEQFFLEIKKRSRGSITSRMATPIATDMVTGLFAPLYGQVNPLSIGEAGRAMSIAGHYGLLLLKNSGIIEPLGLRYIMTEYPSHGFVIDRWEAKELFQNVREPSQEELVWRRKWVGEPVGQILIGMRRRQHLCSSSCLQKGSVRVRLHLRRKRTPDLETLLKSRRSRLWDMKGAYIHD